MTRLDYSWADDMKYIHVENGEVVPNKDAPKEVKEAYERFLKQREAARKRGAM